LSAGGIAKNPAIRQAPAKPEGQDRQGMVIADFRLPIENFALQAL